MNPVNIFRGLVGHYSLCRNFHLQERNKRKDVGSLQRQYEQGKKFCQEDFARGKEFLQEEMMFKGI